MQLKTRGGSFDIALMTRITSVSHPEHVGDTAGFRMEISFDGDVVGVLCSDVIASESHLALWKQYVSWAEDTSRLRSVTFALTGQIETSVRSDPLTAFNAIHINGVMMHFHLTQVKMGDPHVEENFYVSIH